MKNVFLTTGCCLWFFTFIASILTVVSTFCAHVMLQLLLHWPKQTYGVVALTKRLVYSVQSTIKMDARSQECPLLAVNLHRLCFTFLHQSRTMSQWKATFKTKPQRLGALYLTAVTYPAEFCWWARVFWLHGVEHKQQCAQSPLCWQGPPPAPSCWRLSMKSPRLGDVPYVYTEP